MAELPSVAIDPRLLFRHMKPRHFLAKHFRSRLRTVGFDKKVFAYCNRQQIDPRVLQNTCIPLGGHSDWSLEVGSFRPVPRTKKESILTTLRTLNTGVVLAIAAILMSETEQHPVPRICAAIDGTWNNNSTWTLPSSPGAADNAYIGSKSHPAGAAGTATVALGGNQSVGNLYLGYGGETSSGTS